jgi:hypothetical protein
METDADRLASIKALGGQLVSSIAGSFWAIYDAVGTPMQFDEVRINSTSPQLTARTSDVDRLQLTRGVAVHIGDALFAVHDHLPGDAPGWSLLILSKP